MSDQIFKAWDNKNKSWIEKDCFLISSDGLISVQNEDNERFLIDATLCRSTGLKDKNGVMIFENDILTDDLKNILTVKFFKGEFTAENLVGGFKLNHLNDYEFKIIGNIFEHKHLLE